MSPSRRRGGGSGRYTGRAHYSGSYASAATGGHVVYESRLEPARLLLADFDPAVQRIFAQLCRLVARVG